ncbi:MAG: phenylalanine--tRNA ligase subunit beta [Candidatus Nomurabacteria bacterium]
MKFSKAWLQDYIVETLPEDGVISEAFNKKSFEVEETRTIAEQTQNDAEGIQTDDYKDTVFDIKVLPNRAHDALGHRGMARELCADFGFTFKEDERINKNESFFDSTIPAPAVSIENGEKCTRFMGIRIDGVMVTESPKWLRERLESIGQRSINNIVDITNYVQFSLNKPMHAYDTRSIKGILGARVARTGEMLVTLDEKSLNLDTQTLVIVDDEKVLGLAGIKGGKFSGIQSDTTSVILESANFEPTLIRKTSQKYDLRTDASKRFENGIANSLIEEGLYMTANLIKELCADAKVSLVTDIYPKVDEIFSLSVSLDEINAILGTKYSREEVEETFKKLLFKFTTKGNVYTVEVPSERLDIRIKEDVTEEVGRIIGYDKLIPTLPVLNRVGLPHKRMFYENKIREILVRNGFSEVMTYTFGDQGEVELVKGLALDKEKLRDSLGNGILNSLSLNLYNAPLLGEKTIKIFEIGNVFGKDTETRHLSLAIDDGAKKSNFTDGVDMILVEIKRTLELPSLECTTVSTKPYVIEIDFDTMIASLPEPTNYEAPTFTSLPFVNYKSVSSYPFIARDIAMWVPAVTTWESINNLCAEVRNTLVTRVDLFDTFTKEIEGIRKTSFAFRLVFQSYEKTLTDEEVNEMMEAYYKVFKEKGYEIR